VVPGASVVAVVAVDAVEAVVGAAEVVGPPVVGASLPAPAAVPRAPPAAFGLPAEQATSIVAAATAAAPTRSRPRLVGRRNPVLATWSCRQGFGPS
jgi:hypothetical protein